MNLNTNNTPEKENNPTTQVQIERTKLKQSFLHFGTLYRVKSWKWQVFWTFIISILFAFFQMVLVEIAQLYDMGIAALAQSTARLTQFLLKDKVSESQVKAIFNIMFWMVNLLANIPLFVLSYRKIGKKFSHLTLIFMVVSSFAGLGFGFIPGSEHWFVFAEISSNPKMLTWQDGDLKTVAIFFYAIAWGILQAAFAASLLILNACSGGFDMLGVYWSTKKFKDVGATFMFLHLVSLIIANLIGTYVPIGSQTTWGLQTFFGPVFLAGLIMVIINGVALNIFFPKYKLVKVEIISAKIDEIRVAINNLKDRRFTTSVLKVEGGYSGQEQKILFTLCLYLDAAKLMEIVRQHDQNAFITVTNVKKADGYIYVAKDKDESVIANELKDAQKKQDKNESKSGIKN